MDKIIDRSPCLITVVLPVYNAEKYIGQAIDSILYQTYTNFILFIINDGSTDNTEEIILSYTDSRIRYVKNKNNIGLIATLNYAFKLTNTKYIVRMDADDLSLPERIKKQLDYMESHSDVSVCGTQVEYFGNEQGRSSFPLTHEQIKVQLLFSNALAHPTSIIRTQVIKDFKLGYSSNFMHAEDYELWIRVARIGKLINLNDILLKYRLEGQNITTQNWESRDERLKHVYRGLLNELDIQVTEENLKLHLELSGNSVTINNIKKLKDYTKGLLDANKKKQLYASQELDRKLIQLWDQLFYSVSKNGLGKVINYWWYAKRISFTQIRYLLGCYKSINKMGGDKNE